MDILNGQFGSLRGLDLSRDNSLGVDEWRNVLEALKSCNDLKEIQDLTWSNELLLKKTESLDLSGKLKANESAKQDLSALVVLAGLLPHVATTLQTLNLRSTLLLLQLQNIQSLKF